VSGQHCNELEIQLSDERFLGGKKTPNKKDRNYEEFEAMRASGKWASVLTHPHLYVWYNLMTSHANEQ